MRRLTAPVKHGPNTGRNGLKSAPKMFRNGCAGAEAQQSRFRAERPFMVESLIRQKCRTLLGLNGCLLVKSGFRAGKNKILEIRAA
jgi:hypothetical protein